MTKSDDMEQAEGLSEQKPGELPSQQAGSRRFLHFFWPILCLFQLGAIGSLGALVLRSSRSDLEDPKALIANLRLQERASREENSKEIGPSVIAETPTSPSMAADELERADSLLRNASYDRALAVYESL